MTKLNKTRKKSTTKIYRRVEVITAAQNIFFLNYCEDDLSRN